MKPVVSSLVALAIAIAPMTVFAKPAHSKTHIKHKTVHADEKATQVAAKSKDKDKDKADDKSPMVHVKAGKKDGARLKPAVHHAHNVDLAGPGHNEPKVDGQGAIVPASMRAPLPHAKPTGKPSSKASEMPKLPNPNAGKPSKGGAEKGARKPAAQKHDAAADSNDGEPARDEEFAELVARIRGQKTATADADSTGTKDLADDKSAGPMSPPAEKAAKTASPMGTHKGAESADSSKRRAEPCSKEPVEIVRGPEVERFELTKCDGTVAPLAVEHLSIMIRPGGAARPTAPVAELAKKPGPELAHGIRRADPRLVERIQSVVDRFSKPGAPAKLLVISGYRPASIGSMHSAGRAIDFRVDGTKNEEIVAFCKTLGDTGCGYYPNSSFVHIDVRDPGSGHVSWIDASGPGETPRYVHAWPPAPSSSTRQPDSHLEKTSMTRTERLAEEGASLLRARRPVDRKASPEPQDDHPADLEP